MRRHGNVLGGTGMRSSSGTITVFLSSLKTRQTSSRRSTPLILAYLIAVVIRRSTGSARRFSRAVISLCQNRTPPTSVIVPTFMGAALLPTVLDSLVRQDYQGEYEILVIDDGSHDATPEVLEEWSLRFPGRLRVFRQRNSGPASARNKGAREAQGDFLIFVDDDCIAEPTWLRSLQSVFEETGAAAVAGAVVNPDDGWVGRYVNRESIIAHVLSRDGLVQELITGNAGVRAE